VDALASLRYGFEEARLECIISLAVPQNLASRRVMEKAGPTFRGERRWRDVDLVWYAIDRPPGEAPIAENSPRRSSRGLVYTRRTGR
jgi:RimJ/RimL family protein N-acetyltransferase